MLYQIGKMYGKNRANDVLLTKNQYPVVYEVFEDLAKRAGFKEVPDLFLINGNCTISAYATCVPGYRDFAAVYSDLIDGCLKNNDLKTLKMVLGHELGHIRYNHVKWWYNLFIFIGNFPGANFILGNPLSRSREYSADQLGAALADDSTGECLMILAVGKRAYKDINLEKYEQHQFRGGFWATLSNALSSIPSLPGVLVLSNKSEMEEFSSQHFRKKVKNSLFETILFV
jgi:peptidase M48, ste24p